MLQRWLAFFALFWISLGCLFSADTLLIEENFVKKDLIPFTELYIDHTGNLTLEDILQEESLSFVDTFTLDQSEKYPTAYWLHIVVETKIDLDGVRLVVPGDEEKDHVKYLIDYLEMYQLNTKGELLAKEKSGFLIPKSEKTLAYHPLQVAVPLSAKKGDLFEIYIRIQNARTPQTIYLGLELRNGLAGLPTPDFQDRLTLLAPLGMFIIIGLYVLVFYVFVPERPYLYFGIFCFLYAIGLFFIEPEGGGAFFLPNYPGLKRSIWYIHFFCLPFLLLFGNAFIDIKRNFPKWYKYYQVLLTLFLGTPIYYVIRNFWEPYQTRHPLLIIMFLLLIPICIRFILSKNWTARLFALGIFCFLGGNLIGAIAIWQGQPWGAVSWTIGQLVLLFLFAIGLGYRLLESQRQKSKAEKIKELDRLKSRFFANISHEFRTPLSLILGPLQKAEESVPGTELEDIENEIPIKVRHIQVMKRNSLRLQQLIDQILDLSKIESSKMELCLEKGAIIKFIRSRIAEFEDIAGSKGIHLIANYSKELPNAFFDRDKVEKILINILSNAVKFTPPNGEIRLKVKAEEKFLKIITADTGPGMSQVETDHIFDRFYQADQAQQQGSGIGMALVKELVELHKGHISVESQKGGGTTITLTICIDPEYFSSSDFASTPSPPSKEVNFSLAPVHSNTSNKNAKPVIHKNLVLIVEDHPDLQNYLQEILCETHEVITANNGQEGIKLAIEKVPDLIVSDIMMPEVSGIELCQHLKKEEKTSHIPIILLTAKAERKDKIEGLVTGANDYLTKPFDAKELKIKVSNLLQIKDQLREKYSAFLPNMPSPKITSIEEQFLQNVSKAIQKNLSNEYYSVEELGNDIGYSRSQLFRKLKALTGKSPLEMIREHRLQLAKVLLEKNVGTVSEIAYQVGYSHLAYFSKSFKNEFGILPSEVKGIVPNQ